jgi:hypothetical protein
MKYFLLIQVCNRFLEKLDSKAFLNEVKIIDLPEICYTENLNHFILPQCSLYQKILISSVFFSGKKERDALAESFTIKIHFIQPLRF